MKKGYLILLLLVFSGYLFAQNFGTSLHGTRNGKPYWYNADTTITHAPKPGFETLTGVAIDGLGCVQCHGKVNADSVAYGVEYTPSCDGCHATEVGKIGEVPGEWVCFQCHGRQGAEKSMYSDVHRTAGMECWDCHGDTDMHGDGTEYSTMLEPGAIAADCEDCHSLDGTGEGPYPDHADFDPHGDDPGTVLHCTACHSQSVISCYNCHFNSMTEDHNKRAFTKIKDFILLGNRTKDGKVGTLSFQSLTYDTPPEKAGEYQNWIAIAPYTPHTTTEIGRTCDDCHNNANIQEYATDGKIEFAKWNPEDSTLSWKKGVVPFPYDYETTFSIEYITYVGATSDSVGEFKKLWESTGITTIGENNQMFYATGLTEQQLFYLSLDFGTIWENFAVSLHKTRDGKNYWYSEPDGFESLTHVAIDSAKMGCIQCHDKTGGLDADGNPYPADYEADCVDCHGTTTFDDNAALEARCFGCHGRQKSEIGMGFKNAHQDTSNHDVPYLTCWDCHMNDGTNEYMLDGAPVFDDIHGHDTTTPVSMLADGAMKASCENCHPTHDTQHNGAVSCEACHAQTVISCYNCHFNSQLEGNKRAFTKIKNFMMLANRTKSGDVYPMSFQSLTFDNDAGGHDTWVAFGPYTPHAIQKAARGCSDCHNNMGGTNPAIIDYNEDGVMTFAEWDDTDSTLSYHTGVVPMPVDYKTQFKMDFITYTGETTDAVGLYPKYWESVGKDTWDGQQMYFATALDTNQMKALGMETKYVSITDDDFIRPSKFALKQNYPNPFNPSTTIEFDLPFTTEVNLVVFDVLGKEVSNIYNKEVVKAGNHKINFDASKLASGIYFYQLRTKNFVKTRKMFMLK